jgi:F-type H+-transporting ATPase subunit epsilon
MLHIQIISPVATLYEGDVDYAVFPGAKGAFAVHSDHAPIVSLLRQGGIRCVTGKNTEEAITIQSGFVEVCDNKIVACVEQ